MPEATTVIDMEKGADGTWSVPPPGGAAREGNMTGTYAARAGSFVAGPIAAAITPGGCSNNDAVKTINSFLDWGGGIGKAAVVGAAFVYNPIAGIGAQFAISSWQQATEAGCAPGVPSPPATAKAVDAVPAATATALGSGGVPALTADQAEMLQFIWGAAHSIVDNGGLSMQEEGLFSWVRNPLFWTNSYSALGNLATAEAEELMGVRADSRNVGESSFDWLTRVLPSWTVGHGDLKGGTSSEFIEITPKVAGQALPSVLYPWDVWGQLQDAGAKGWRGDFAKYYKFQIADNGPFWSMLGFMGHMAAANGYDMAALDQPPVAE